jgi:hypothetical protein
MRNYDYAYYTRYPRKMYGWPKEAEDLVCPRCGGDQIVILTESRAEDMLGDTAQCWTCKHQFIVTDNCWKFRKIK